MSQNWVADLYTTGTIGDTTLSNMELMFATLRSSFSGSSAPSNPVDGNLWYDSSAKELLKVYRNGSWAGVMVGSASFKIWVYLDTAEDGWAIDSTSVTDRILAFKGGSTYTAGGANAGSWTLAGLTKDAHTHVAGALLIPDHTHTLPFFTGNIPSTGTNKWGQITGIQSVSSVTGITGAQSDSGITSDASWRPAGAVGTLQYPNV